MPDDNEERIRRRAHKIWEREGRPQGLHLQHWDRAALEIAEEQSGLLQSSVDEALGGSGLQAGDKEPNTTPLTSAEPALRGTPIGEAAARARRARTPKS
jgi:hypothetical protein